MFAVPAGLAAKLLQDLNRITASVVDRMAGKALASNEHLFVHDLELTNMSVSVTRVVVVDEEITPASS